MPEENINQEFRLKKIYEIRNYLIEEINQNKLLNKKHKKVCRVLNYIDHSLTVISTITGCVPISDFASLVGIPIGITSSAIGLKMCVMTAGIKKSKSIIKKKKKKDDEIYDTKDEIKNSNNKFSIYKTMLRYCLKCRKNTESKNPEVSRTKNGRRMLLSKFVVCKSK